MSRTVSRKKEEIEKYELLVGVDVGKKRNEAVLINKRWRRLGKLSFSQTYEGYEQFTSWVRENQAKQEGKELVVGLEPTNDYWCWLANQLEKEEIAYRLVNPYTVKKSREGAQLDKSKDDPRDGWTIARLVGEGQYTETKMAQGIYREMRHYEQAHWRLRKQIREQKTVLRQIVERGFPELQQVFKAYDGKTCKALLANHADPQKIAQLGWPDFLKGVRQDFTGKRLCIGKLRQIYELAPSSIGLPCLGSSQRLIRQRLAMLQQQQAQCQELEEALIACLHRLPAAKSWCSIGMSQLQTALIVAELGDLNRFRRANQLVKLAGIQPTPNQSGQKVRAKTPMSHQGRPRLRTYLFWATLRLLGSDPAFRARRQILTSRPHRPLVPMEAVGALMNKLLHLLWALWSHDTLYSADQFMPT